MKRVSWVLLVGALLVAGCSHKEQPTGGGESGGGTAATSSPAAATEQAATGAPATGQAATSAPAGGKLYATFTFTDIAVSTSGAPVLRLGFQLKNSGPDPLLCEEGSFTLQLSDGSVINPDAGAENRCDPDTIDAGSTGTGTMFFDLKSGYNGPVTLIMTDNGTVIGRGTAQVH